VAANPAPKPAAGKGGSADEAPTWTPMPATTGTLGLFTVESGETLPAKGFSFSAYANKFSRAPGSVSVLGLGWSFAVGVADRVSLYVQMEPHRHVHIGKPSQLSLDTPSSGAFQPFGHTFYRSLVPCSPPSVPCRAPGYVEEFPFAFANGGGIGDITAGIKFNLLSEQRGNPFSLSLRNEFNIPTRSRFADLLDNEVQMGVLNFNVGLAASKTLFNHSLVAMLNGDYRFTKDPHFSLLNTATGLIQPVSVTLADQVRVGAGFLLFPERRLQIMTEYTGVIFVGDHTPNTSFGPRDPVDGVWGIRFYPARWMAIDAGYRYMLNLKQVNDRNGFVVKVGVVDWPEKAKAPDVLTASCSVEKNAVMQDAGEQVGASVHATDSYNHPLTYTWTATGGQIAGSGPEVRWNSAGVAPGNYTITARVDDGQGNTQSCSDDVTVNAKPNPPPTMTCAVDRSSVLVGERVNVSANVNDQSGTPLSYAWQATGGQIVGSGATVQLDTTGLSPGSYTVTGRVQNGNGGAADCTTNVSVQVPPPPPQASKLNECLFQAESARTDNVCKRILDDVALRLQNDPKGRVVVIGYSAPAKGKAAERRAAKLAQDRATNSQKYIGQKGVAESRVEVRSATGQEGGGKENHRVDIIWVPDGASF